VVRTSPYHRGMSGRRLQEEDVREVLRLRYLSHMSYTDIIRRMRGISLSSVTRICQGSHPDSARLLSEMKLKPGSA
jgi:hypothetical protein